MPSIFETTMFRAHWGFTRAEQPKAGKHTEVGIVEPNWKSAEDEIAVVMADIEEGNWEIKASLPLIASEYATHREINRQTDQSYAVGWGYGAPFTDGVIFLCQRKLEMSETDFAIYEAKRSEKETERRAERLRSFAAEFPISEKRKLLGSTVYLFKSKEYPTRTAAEAERDAAMARIK
jgi:hypothetical protein